MTETYKNRKYWGWGRSDITYPPARLEQTLNLISFGLGMKLPEKMGIAEVEDISLKEPRFALPEPLRSICTDDPFQRLLHTYGQSFRDVWRAIRGQFSNAPDYVAFPKDEADLKALFAFAAEANVGLMIYGGGTSVVGGVECPESSRREGFISVDLTAMCRVLEINETNLTARVQAGITGPDLEQQLKAAGLVLRHYPQSFEFSTVGGWIATRAGGHYATVFTQIDHFVQNLRMCCPDGSVQTRSFPNSGAGPNENRFFTGSEGIFGIITEATMKVQKVPAYRASATVRFKTFAAGTEACRALAQSQLSPTNARLVDPMEALAHGLGDGTSTVLILGFESPTGPVDASMEMALDICKAHGGTWTKAPKEGRDEKADDWKQSFLMAPYLRDELILRGLIVETFETCTTWEKFPALDQHIREVVAEAIAQSGGKGMITCRFTHLYPDGPAPYYTVIAQSVPGTELERWDAIKKAASEALATHGGTISHHHAVGRDHRPYFQREQDWHFQEILRAAKRRLDPDGLLNEGVLID